MRLSLRHTVQNRSAYPCIAHRSPPLLTLRVADTFWSRLLGLHALATLADHDGLWITPCAAVHTFALRYAIDVIFLDGKLEPLKCVVDLKPNRWAFHAHSSSVVELPAGYCRRNPNYRDAIYEAISRYNEFEALGSSNHKG